MELGHVLQRQGQVEGSLRQVDLAGLQPREVQDVGEDVLQQPAGVDDQHGHLPGAAGVLQVREGL